MVFYYITFVSETLPSVQLFQLSRLYVYNILSKILYCKNGTKIYKEKNVAKKRERVKKKLFPLRKKRNCMVVCCMSLTVAGWNRRRK